MDPEQFQQLMHTLTTAFQGMSQAQPTRNITLLSNFDTFDTNKETFTQYKERFENYLKLKNVFADKDLCAQIFLNSLGSSGYDLLSTLALPRKVTDLTYDDITNMLGGHFPKLNEIVQQHKFLSTVQQPNESISDYVTSLKKHISSCNVTCSACHAPVSDLFLRAQFIRGIRDSSIRENLLQQEELTFDSAVRRALAIEASKINSNVINDFTRHQTSTDMSIHKVARKSTRHRSSDGRSRSRSTSSVPGSAATGRPVEDRRWGQVDLSTLGLDGVCLRCGKRNHTSTQCRIHRSQLRCKSCNREGHVAKVCIKSLLSRQNNAGSVKHLHSGDDNQTGESDADDLYSVGQLSNICDIHLSDTDKFTTTVLINNLPQRFEVDSGCAHTLIPVGDCYRLHISLDSLQPTPIKFRSYTKELLSPLGIATVHVESNGTSSLEQLFVVPDGYSPLLGRTWIRHLHINLNNIDGSSERDNNINSVSDNVNDLIHKIETQYSEILKPTIGCIPNISTHLQLRPQAKPVFLKPRPLPFALRDQVGKELDRLEEDNIITKIDLSDWGSPLVVVPKPDGSLRLCADYKPTVNSQLYDAHYPIPKIDENLHKLRNASYFCTLDVFKAYLHVAVDDESALVQAISTHKGTYKVNRLSFGIKTAPSLFNQIIEKLLGDLPGVSTYFDDIIVYGSTLQDCYNNLCSCLERLQQNNLHINYKKCIFFQKSITYLGFVVEHNQISKSPTKVSAILNADPPQSIDDVRKFLGLVTYYSKFIPSASTLTYPLRQLLGKNKKFHWTKACQDAFDKIKQEIASDRVLIPYDPDLPLSLACDASPFGVAGVLSHTVNGTERPIAFASRSLTKAESNYSQLDREALAIVFAVNRFFPYLYGRQFDLVTDNQPLTRIFHPKNVPPMSAGRLLRYAVFLRGFEYTIKHRKASGHTNVDYLSRSPVSEQYKGIDTTLNREVEEIELMSILQLSSVDISSTSIAQETLKDVKMKDILQQLKDGTNDPLYSINQGVVFRGDRVYVPQSLRSHVLQELHSTHVGIVRMKRLARRYCYWPGIDKDIEHNVRSCVPCSVHQNQPAKVSHSWETPTENFERVHIDYAGPFHGCYFLVLVDAKSKWPEVRITKSAPTTATTVDLLQDIFSSHGYPASMVSDNASIFTSNEFQGFCNQSGIVQKFSAPGHPATNGLAERYIQTIKLALERNMEGKSSSSSLLHHVRRILFRYRATPLQCGQSPAELYLNRKIRTELDMMQPPSTSPVQRCYPPVPRSFNEGERVLVRMEAQWKFGKVITRLGALHYRVQLDSGYVLKKHINQLKRTEVPESETTIGPHENSQKPKTENFVSEKVKFKEDIENSDITFFHRSSTTHQPNINSPILTRPPPPRHTSRKIMPPKRYSP